MRLPLHVGSLVPGDCYLRNKPLYPGKKKLERYACSAQLAGYVT